MVGAIRWRLRHSSHPGGIAYPFRGTRESRASAAYTRHHFNARRSLLSGALSGDLATGGHHTPEVGGSTQTRLPAPRDPIAAPAITSLSSAAGRPAGQFVARTAPEPLVPSVHVLRQTLLLAGYRGPKQSMSILDHSERTITTAGPFKPLVPRVCAPRLPDCAPPLEYPASNLMLVHGIPRAHDQH